MKPLVPVVILIFALIATWWFWGREPYITMGHPSDPVLIYHEPEWSGWNKRGLKWVSNIPQAMKDEFPEAEGWWHIIRQTVPDKDLPSIDMKNLDIEKSMRELEKYYVWVPLYYNLPDGPAGKEKK